MAKLAVCIEPFFADRPYAERIKAVAELGFTAYEFWFHDKRFDGASLVPESKDFDAIAELNARYGLTTTDFVFNHPDGGIVASLIDRRDRQKLLDSIEGMIGLARKIGCRSFISGSGNKVPGLSREAAMESMVEGLRALAPICERAGVTIILEPFNSRVNHPDYFLDDPTTCVDVLKMVGSPSVKMLYDIYHMQIMDGNVLSFVRENLRWIGHFHVAGVPGRNEPVPCELDYPFILRQIDAMGYDGYFGLEYWPTTDSAASLTATKRALSGR
ncbi:MAG TPA: TIM barrel protein [Spirochaetia bacterium]